MTQTNVSYPCATVISTLDTDRYVLRSHKGPLRRCGREERGKAHSRSTKPSLVEVGRDARKFGLSRSDSEREGSGSPRLIFLICVVR